MVDVKNGKIDYLKDILDYNGTPKDDHNYPNPFE